MTETLAKQKKLITIFVVIAAVAIIIYWRYCVLFPGTDNAYVQANIVNVAPQVSGKVSEVLIQNHQLVTPGQVLFKIDPKPFIIALQQAQAQLDVTKQQIAEDQDAVTTAKAVVAQRTAEFINAKADSNRAIRLAKIGVLSRQAADDAQAKILTAQASLDAAKAQLQQAQDTLGKIGDQNAYLQKAEAAVAQAQLNLDYTTITSSAKGNVENLTLRVGDTVTTNTPVFAIVDETEWWVDANYNETDLERIRPGQKASISVDMYPGKDFKGQVESISRGSGATFSLLPPENATGNWVKVTQRFPVRIRIINHDKNTPLRVGASATVTIDTRN